MRDPDRRIHSPGMPDTCSARSAGVAAGRAIMVEVRVRSHDVVVLGAGPAGGNAALAAAECGLDVILIDEAPLAGGQVWRAPATEAARTRPKDSEKRAGDALRTALASAGITHLAQSQLWSVDRTAESFDCAIHGPQGFETIQSRQFIAAPGAIERILPFPGWTTPGIFGLAAATAMLKAENTLPGRRVVIGGQGPLLVAVAAQAIALGLVPVAVIDSSQRSDWLRGLSGFGRVPRELARGLRWMLQIRRAGVRILHGHEIVHATGGESLTSVVARDRATGVTCEIAADTAFVGNGLFPSDDIFRLLGARQEHDTASNAPRTATDRMGRSSVPGLFAIGDGACIRGALPAATIGRIAGFAASCDAGAITMKDLEHRTRSLLQSKARRDGFATASCRLMSLDDRRIAALPGDTVICRCESVSAADLRRAVAEGAHDINQLKHFTRVGMGPCQGRMCAANAAAILRDAAGDDTGETRLTVRQPLRPLATADLIGTFDYDDIPIPRPAPL